MPINQIPENYQSFSELTDNAVQEDNDNIIVNKNDGSDRKEKRQSFEARVKIEVEKYLANLGIIEPDDIDDNDGFLFSRQDNILKHKRSDLRQSILEAIQISWLDMLKEGIGMIYPWNSTRLPPDNYLLLDKDYVLSKDEFPLLWNAVGAGAYRSWGTTPPDSTKIYIPYIENGHYESCILGESGTKYNASMPTITVGSGGAGAGGLLGSMVQKRSNPYVDGSFSITSSNKNVSGNMDGSTYWSCDIRLNLSAHNHTVTNPTPNGIFRPKSIAMPFVIKIGYMLNGILYK